MSQSRFEKAAILAEQLKTWNHNDVARVVKECLGSQRQNTRALGTPDFGHGIEMDEEGQPRIDYNFDNPMECFHTHVAVGLNPPLEVMICMERCIRDYFLAGGNISLDEAFFGKEHVATKSYAKLNYDKSLHSKYAFFDATKKFSKRKSLQGKAEEFLSERLGDHSTDPATFLKGYSRWKSNKNS